MTMMNNSKEKAVHNAYIAEIEDIEPICVIVERIMKKIEGKCYDFWGEKRNKRKD